MGTGYTRNDTPNNIADGNVINASDLDGEFDAIQSAFNATTGHSHDGTSGEGPQIDTGGIADDAVTLGTKTTGNYVATGAVSGVGLSGSASSEGATFTITSNATSANTASTIVARDASGNFSAGTITASLTGTASNAALLDSLDSTQFLRSDVADTKTAGDLSFADNVKAIFGAGSDLQIYHNGTDSVVDDQGTGKLVLKGNTAVEIRGTNGEDLAGFNMNGAVNLYHNNAPKFATTSSGIDITGNAVFDDNGKAMFGAGNDLQIYHDGSNSYIEDTGTGNLRMKGATKVQLLADNNEDMLHAIAGGAVELYYDNSKKLDTTSTGVDVTGTLTSDGLTVDGDVTLNDGSPNLRLQDTDTSRYIDMAYGTRVAKFTNTMASGEDIDTVEPWIEFSFKDDGETRTAMTIDHDGNLLVGTTSTISSNTNGGLYVSNNGYTSLFNRESAAGDGNIMLFAKGGTTVGSISTEGNDLAIGNADAGLQFVDGAERVRPFNVSTNAATDGLLDLGDSSKRFKDLYLSGGAYLGGTGSANHLDDYEEGTWTPVDYHGSVSLTVYEAYYTKIGQRVFFEMGINIASNSSSNVLRFSGLPFTSKSGDDNTGGAFIVGTNSGRQDIFFVNRGQATIACTNSSNSDVAFSNYSNKQLKLHGSYITDS